MPDSRALSVRGALRPLIEKVMWEAGWAGDIAWFQFGQKVTALNRAGRSREVGEYALHISTAWVWQTDTGFVRADEDSAELADLGPLMARVQSISPEVAGGLELRFGNGDLLRVEAGSAGENPREQMEYWRLLQPGRKTPHVVSSSLGVEWHEA